MNNNPDFEVLLDTRTRLEIIRCGTECELRIGESAYSTSFQIPKDAVNEMIENFKRSYPRRERGVNEK